MKKIIVLTACLLFVATSAFAAATITISFAAGATGKSLYGDTASATSSSPLIGKNSTGVGVGVKVDATAGAGYSLITQHAKGSKAFGTSYDSTSIYSSNATVGTPLKATPSATDTTDFTSWDIL